MCLPIQIRQGDVFLEKIESIPEGATRAPDCVIALGTVTGHSHRFESGAEQYVTGQGAGRKQYIRVTGESADLVHHEHATIKVEQGDYEVIHQIEYDPIANRAVMD